MKQQPNKGLNDFIEQAMNADELVQRGPIHGDPKGIIIIDECDDFNPTPEQIAALLNLSGRTTVVSGSTEQRAEHLLDMFNELENSDETKKDKKDS